MSSRTLALLILVTLCLVAVGSSFADETITGRAAVIDGDTIEIAGQRIRLDGIDAPEASQSCNNAAGEPYPCGRASALALDLFLASSRPTRCDPKSRDRYQRIVAVCYRADGTEVNAWLVRNGHAIDFRRYSKGRYGRYQALAQREGKGMWRGLFINPAEVRKLKRGSP